MHITERYKQFLKELKMPDKGGDEPEKGGNQHLVKHEKTGAVIGTVSPAYGKKNKFEPVSWDASHGPTKDQHGADSKEEAVQWVRDRHSDYESGGVHESLGSEAEEHARDLRRTAGTNRFDHHFGPLKQRSAAYLNDVSKYYFGAGHQKLTKQQILDRLKKHHEDTPKK